MTQPRTLFDKIWEQHAITETVEGDVLLYVDRCLIHEGSSHAFEKIVESFSQGPRADVGGFYEMTDKQVGDWPPPLPAEIRRLKPGETSGRIPPPQGVHYVYMEDRVKGEQLSFEDAQEQIRRVVSQNRRRMQLQRFWSELKRKAIIKIFMEDEPAGPALPGG